MDLTVTEVAQLLKQSESQIKELAQQGKIPCYHLKDELRFSFQELEGFLSQNIFESASSISPSIGIAHYCLYRALHHGNLFTNVVADNKEQIILAGAKLAAEQMQIDPDLVAEMLFEREQMMSTALGMGFALPHPRDSISELARDQLFILYPEKPLPFGALDGQDVHTFFFLFSSNDKSHLNLLAKIAHLLNNQQSHQLFQQRRDKDALLQFVRKWESGL